MSKKYLLLIVLCLIVVAGALIYTQMPANDIKVGSSAVEIPKGYTILQQSEHGGIFVNGENKIAVYENENSTQDSVKNYTQKHKGDLLKNSTEKIAGIEVYKFELKDNSTKQTKITHLFFDKNSKPYHIYLRGNYDAKAVNAIINSL
ncbi:hypothetical protein [Methanobrevibacter sp.]